MKVYRNKFDSMITKRKEVYPHDYFKTPISAIKMLANNVAFFGDILNPFCGDGIISKTLIEYNYRVISTDINPRNYGRKYDFFKYDKTDHILNIVSNPPFSIATDAVSYALKISNKKVAFLLRLAFIETQKRYEMIFKHFKPILILAPTKRFLFINNDTLGNFGGGLYTCWFIWDTEKFGTEYETVIKWIQV